MQTSKKLQALEAPLKEKIWRMHQMRLGYAPSVVTCNFIKGSNLVISLERTRSATEQFLLKQEKLQLAHDVGIAINHVLKNEIGKILTDNFNLPITEFSFLTPFSVEAFSAWAVVEDKNQILTGNPQKDATA